MENLVWALENKEKEWDHTGSIQENVEEKLMQGMQEDNPPPLKWEDRIVENMKGGSEAGPGL